MINRFNQDDWTKNSYEIGDTMLNDRWAKRILRAAKTEVIASDVKPTEEFKSNIINRDCEMKNCVKDHAKIMEYLHRENASGHAHNLDMLLASLNVNQHLREAFLSAEVSEGHGMYVLSFPFGVKKIEYILSKKAVDNE